MPTRIGRRAPRWWALGLGLLAGIISGCRPDCTPRAGAARPNVILVTIDTLRADHLGCYGNRTVRTPTFDRLAAEGLLFERCYAQAPITIPSHLSLMSSLPLAVHGVLSNYSAAPERLDVLPDVFRHAGYRTAAFVSAKHVGPLGILGKVLGSFEVYRGPRRSMQRPAADTNAEALPWLRATCREPLFAWIHYYDPHMPYTPPPPYDAAYYQGDPFDPRYTSMLGLKLNWYFYELGGLRHALSQQATAVRALKAELGLGTRQVRDLLLSPEHLERYADGPDRARLLARLHALGDVVRPRLPYRRLAAQLTGVRDLDFPLARYSGEVSYVDHQLGVLRTEIERLGIAPRTVVLVTADHGESLGEHGVYFDHFGLNEPDVRVPLVLWGPGRIEPGRRTDVARGIDVAPTLIRLAGLVVPSTMQGRDLLGPASDPASAPIVAEAARGLQVMAFDGTWKLIRTLHSFHYVDALARSAGTTELYDLAHDPAERDDVAAGHPDVAHALGAHLDGWMASEEHAARPLDVNAPAVPPAVERSLRALGYVE